MSGLVIGLMTFLAVFLGILTINLVFTDMFKQDRRQQLDALETELRNQMTELADQQTKADYKQLSRIVGETKKAHSLTMTGTWNHVNDYVNQGDIKASLEQLVLLGVVGAIATGGGLLLLTQSWLIAAIGAAIAATIPIFYVKIKRYQRLEKLTTQLPDALDLMGRILRAGQTIEQGLLVVSEEFKPPVSQEFGYCYEKQKLGLGSDIALRQLAERTGILEIRIFVMAVLIHQQSGGNLAQLLDKLSKIIRGRLAMRMTIQGLTAEGRLQAAILLGLPFVMWVLMTIVNRDYGMRLLDHPELILFTVSVMAVGAIWIRKIVYFDF